MATKPFGICLTGIIFVACCTLGNCHLDDNYDDDLSERQIQIFKNYHAIAKLSYGDKCNFELESKGDDVREGVKVHWKKVMTSAIQHGLDDNEEEFQLTSSQEDARDLFIDGIEDFTNHVKNSKDGFNGICNDTKSLFCDRDFGECRCGKPKGQKTKGFTYVQADGNCRFDFGSGCLQSEFSELTILRCRAGSTCITGIEGMECTMENTMNEGQRNPSRFKTMHGLFGYTCYCQKSGYSSNSDTNNIPATYSRNQFSGSGSISLYSEFCSISLPLFLFLFGLSQK